MYTHKYVGTLIKIDNHLRRKKSIFSKMESLERILVLLGGTEKTHERTRVWSIDFLSPYLVLLRQSKVAFSGPSFSRCVVSKTRKDRDEGNR